MKIRWEESVPKFGYLKLHLQDGTNRDATTEDLLLACKASELVVVSAKRVEDMRKLLHLEATGELGSVEDMIFTAFSRCTGYDKQVRELRAVLGDGPEGESIVVTARRVVTERETAKCGLRECALAVGLVVQPADLLWKSGPMGQVLGAIRNAALEAKERAAAVKAAEESERLRFSERATIAQVDAVIVNRLKDERDDAIARAEKAEAELEAARASASLVTMVGDIGVRNSGDATRLEAILAERDALAAELAAIRAATGEEPTDEVARMREEVATLRARVAELEAAPQGQPVATDEDLAKVGENAIASAGRMSSMSEVIRIVALAVARHVRAERPACLVARAVALGVDVRVAEDAAGWLVAAHESAYLDEVIERDIPAADVPATLSRMLDEVEASRKAVQR